MEKNTLKKVVGMFLLSGFFLLSCASDSKAQLLGILLGKLTQNTIPSGITFKLKGYDFNTKGDITSNTTSVGLELIVTNNTSTTFTFEGASMLGTQIWNSDINGQISDTANQPSDTEWANQPVGGISNGQNIQPFTTNVFIFDDPTAQTVLKYSKASRVLHAHLNFTIALYNSKTLSTKGKLNPAEYQYTTYIEEKIN
jgi:hypothetical protein